MGRSTPRSSGLAGALFSSVQQRVLGLLFGWTERDFSTSEVIRQVAAGTGAVHRELARLAAADVVTVKSVGNQKRYQANPASPIFEELRGLVVKTVGVVDPIRQALMPHADAIATAFVFGSVAKREDTSSSDIDVMIVAQDLSASTAYAALAAAESSLGRRIEPTIVTPAEWREKLSSGASFFARVNAQPKLFVFGSQHDLDRIAESREDRPAQAREAGSE